MHSPHISFTLAEKMAVVNAVNAVILADGNIHNGEITALTQLMERLDFDSNFIMQARNIDSEQAIEILKSMPEIKKNSLKEILESTAISDGFKHTKESDLMEYIYNSMNFIN